jgi:hypothetical protein
MRRCRRGTAYSRSRSFSCPAVAFLIDVGAQMKAAIRAVVIHKGGVLAVKLFGFKVVLLAPLLLFDSEALAVEGQIGTRDMKEVREVRGCFEERL